MPAAAAARITTRRMLPSPTYELASDHRGRSDGVSETAGRPISDLKGSTAGSAAAATAPTAAGAGGRGAPRSTQTRRAIRKNGAT